MTEEIMELTRLIEQKKHFIKNSYDSGSCFCREAVSKTQKELDGLCYRLYKSYICSLCQYKRKS